MAVRTFAKWREGSSAAGNEGMGEYNSYNAQVYENGTLGPRPGWKEWTVASASYSEALDTVYGMTIAFPEDDVPHLVVHYYDATTSLAHEAEPFSLDEATQTATGTGGSPFTLTGMSVGEFSQGKLNSSNFLDRGKPPTRGDGLTITIAGFVTFVNGTTVETPIKPTNLSVSGAVPYRERMYYYAEDAFPGRIYYSFPANYVNWDDGTAGGAADWSGNTAYFEISPEPSNYPGAAVDMWAIKNALLIAAKGGKWYVLTGASPDVGSLRELGRDVVPEPNTGVVVDNELYFLNPNGQGVVVATPSFVESRQYRYLAPTAYPGHDYTRPDSAFQPLHAVGDDQTGSLFLPGRLGTAGTDIMAAERVNDVWNLSRWTKDDETPEDIVFTVGRPNEIYAKVMEAADWPLYSRNFTLNRPANSGDSLSKALGSEDGDSSNTSNEVVVELGETVAGEGMVVRPTKVVLDIDYWKGGNYSAPELKIDATIHGTEAATSEDALTQQTVTTTSWGNTTGDLPNHRRVAVALPQGQWGTRFDITITYDNLALDIVQVYYDEQRDPR